VHNARLFPAYFRKFGMIVNNNLHKEQVQFHCWFFSTRGAALILREYIHILLEQTKRNRTIGYLKDRWIK